jgi:hypothetical protein
MTYLPAKKGSKSIHVEISQHASASTMLHWQPGLPPFRKTINQPEGCSPAPAQDLKGLCGQYTIGAPAIGYDVAIWWDLLQSLLELGKGD